MALRAQITARQSQSLVISHQLVQAIRLLQLSSAELEDYISAEIEANPLIDRHDGSQSDSGANLELASSVIGQLSDETVVGMAPGGSDVDRRQPVEGIADAGSVRVDDSSAERVEGEIGLQERFDAYIESRFSNLSDRMIARQLAMNLDGCGYLTIDPDELSQTLGIALADVGRVLEICRQFEPAGMFATSLRECLALQLQASGRLDLAMERFLDNIDMLADGRINELRLACGVNETEFSELVDEIRALNPKPGVLGGKEPIRPIIPDVVVTARAEGAWRVELNDETLPKVLVNRDYYAEIKGKVTGSDRRFITDCMQKATWLERSLDQRAQTILRVATEMVAQQAAFLDHGVGHLRPMNLRCIADQIDIHDSTVSRATANKYIATPRGLFEMKYFFSSALPSSDGTTLHSAESVRHRIRSLIEAEPPNAVLSDDALVGILNREGIDIARRTVAKYRVQLNLPTSAQRRKERAYKNAAG